MSTADWSKETVFAHGLFKASNFSPLKKACISLLVIFALVTSFFDDMGVMKHIWLATLFAYFVFQFYRHAVLPKLSAQLVTDSSFKANSFVIVATYILSSLCGAGLMTAFLNLIGVSAAVTLLLPLLPKYYLPTVAAIGSVVFITLASFKALHFLISIPLAIILAALSFYYFKTAATPDSPHEDDDIENFGILSGLPSKKSSNSNSGKLEILKTVFALFTSLIVALLIFYWIILSMNPFWMRATRISKYETLHRLPHDANLRVREVSSLADLHFYKKNIKSFPVVIKPSICTTNSRNVMKCDNYKCLERYLTKRIAEGPLGDGKNGDKGAWVIQEYAPELEGVVFYYKLPYLSNGYIKNIGIRNASTKDEQTKDSSKLTAQYWPGQFRTDFSPEYVNYFNDLASKIPGYNGGRLDVMLPSDDLKDPRGVAVLELNVFFLGCIEEKKPGSVLDEIKRLRTSLVQIYIGIVNIVAGYNFSSLFGILLKVPELVSRAVMCNNHEHLMAKP